MVTRKIKQKLANGTELEADIGVLAENVLEDEKHRFVTDAEKEAISKGQNAKHCYVGQSGSATTNPWYKFASVIMNREYDDRIITFKVSKGHEDFGTAVGILTAHIRTNGTKTYQNSALVWEYVGSKIELEDFVLAYKSTANTSTEIGLWVKVDTAYASYHFEVLSEHSRSTFGDYFALYTKFSAGSEAAIPSDYTQVQSTLLTLQNADLEELKKSVADGKTQVANAISNKGVTTATDATFATMATNVGKIIKATGNATADQVLAGRTFSNASGSGTGTMTNNGVTKAATYIGVNTSAKYAFARFPAGYYYLDENGTQNPYISLPYETLATAIGLTKYKLLAGTTVLGIAGDAAVMNTSTGNATAVDIANGKSAFVNGKKIVGTSNMRNVGWATEDDRLRFKQSGVLIKSGMGNFASFEMEHEWEYYSIIVKSLTSAYKLECASEHVIVTKGNTEHFVTQKYAVVEFPILGDGSEAEEQKNYGVLKLVFKGGASCNIEASLWPPYTNGTAIGAISIELSVKREFYMD